MNASKMMLWIPLVSLLGAAVADGQSKGAMSWDAAVSAAQKLAAKMTTAEMNSIVYGTGQTVGLGTTSAGCAGSLNALDRLGIPRLCFQDGSHGVHGAELVNGYAAGYSVGASWNTDLAYQRGLYMGAEFKAKGVHVALGPVVGPLGRTVEGGRNWEGFGADRTRTLASFTVAPVVLIFVLSLHPGETRCSDRPGLAEECSCEYQGSFHNGDELSSNSKIHRGFVR